MGKEKKRICPVERAGSLDSRFRRLIQNPAKILKPYIREGMTVMDVGCGPGFFSGELASMVGAQGRVISVDLQDGMLKKLHKKIEGTELKDRIVLHKCKENEIGFAGTIDFALLFYVAHEIPDQQQCFKEIASILKPGGQILIVEPPIHVSKSDFKKTIEITQKYGFRLIESPKIFLSKTAVMQIDKPD